MIIDNNNIYELKCIEELTKTHILQLAIYMFLYKINNLNENVYITYIIYETIIKNKKIIYDYIFFLP